MYIRFLRPFFILLLFVPLSAQAQWHLFGTSEQQFEDVATFKKWTDVWARYPRQHSEQETICKTRFPQAACVLTGWLMQLQSLRGLSRYEQLVAVNKNMNSMPYIEDIVNWGMQDYWATPIEFLRRSGDCEDYAIAKYKSLRELGFSEEHMRIVVLNDLNLQVLHAVLAVEDGDKLYILDNQIAELAQSDRIFHYQPIYSINEEHWWRHQPRMR